MGIAMDTSTAEGHNAVIHDSQPLWLDAFEAVLERINVAVLGKAAHPEQALAYLSEYRPALFVTDLSQPNDSATGITLIRRAAAAHPTLRIVVLPVSGDPETIAAAFTAGAAACVVKTAHPDDLASAIRQAFQHSIFLPSVASASLVPAAYYADAAGLTRRELEVLQLVSEGHANAAVARMFWITEQTVKFHLSNIYRKIDVSNRTEASRWAQSRGLLDNNIRSIA